jgi:hypothetical protein
LSSRAGKILLQVEVAEDRVLYHVYGALHVYPLFQLPGVGRMGLFALLDSLARPGMEALAEDRRVWLLVALEHSFDCKRETLTLFSNPVVCGREI